MLPSKYDQFIAAVRRFRPSDLIRQLGAISSPDSLNLYRPNRRDVIYPWVVAAAARESIAWGNEYRNSPITPRSLTQLNRMYTESRDPFLQEHGDENALMSFLIRTAFEQFPYQHTFYEDMARVLPLLDVEAPQLEVLKSPAVWKPLLGCSLGDFIRVGSLISTGAWKNGGLFRPDWLSMPHFSEITDRVPREVVLTTFYRHFGSSWDEAKAGLQAGRPQDNDLRRHDFNYLTMKPFVEVEPGHFIAPQTLLVGRKVSPNSLYYAGISTWNDAFTRDLGHLYERYVGLQLDLLVAAGGCEVFTEIEYESGKLSCDFLVVSGEFCFCIEVKAARVAVPGRIDMQGYWVDVRKDVGKAFDQIAVTGGLIRSEHRELPDTVRGKTIRGVVITAEPHYLINSVPVRKKLPSPTYPSAVISIAQLEELIRHWIGGQGPQALDEVTKPGQNIYDSRFDDGFKVVEARGNRGPNPILDDGFERGQWTFGLDNST